MANAGYRGNTEALRPVNEVRFEARWKLGQLLAKVERERHAGPGRGHEEKTTSRPETGFRAYLKEIGLNKDRANECERIAAIPEPKLKAAFEERAKEGVLNTIQSLFTFARPFWKVKVRSSRHRKIMDAASARLSRLRGVPESERTDLTMSRPETKSDFRACLKQIGPHGEEKSVSRAAMSFSAT